MEAAVNGQSHITQEAFVVGHSSDVAVARRAGLQMAQSLGFDETRAGKLAIAITELATNMLRHATDGQVLLIPMQHHESPSGMEVLGLDHGPGIANLAHSMQDGTSSTGTSGTGLGAMRRLSDGFDVYSLQGRGTGIYLCFWQGDKPAAAPFQTGAVCLPLPTEDLCGDAWAYRVDSQNATFMVSDGLGHGPEAARASQKAVETLGQEHLPPKELVEACHRNMQGSRGAALGVAQFEFESQQIRFAGVGNISVCLVDGDKRKHLVSHNGIVGSNLRKVQEMVAPWPAGSLCIMHSDGLGTHWNLEDYPGLSACHPALIAGILYKDHSRRRDDVTVLVIKTSER